MTSLWENERQMEEVRETEKNRVTAARDIGSDGGIIGRATQRQEKKNWDRKEKKNCLPDLVLVCVYEF